MSWFTRKRIAVFFDGTSMSMEPDSFVYQLYLRTRRRRGQASYYVPGVGTGAGLPIFKAMECLRGSGVDKQIQAAYCFIRSTYEPGDSIYLVGYSRGAHSARVLTDMLGHGGIRDPPYVAYNRQVSQVDSVGSQSIPVRFLGLFDSVSSGLGIPPANSEHVTATKIVHLRAANENRKVLRASGPSGKNVTDIDCQGFHGTLGRTSNNPLVSTAHLKKMVRSLRLAGLQVQVKRSPSNANAPLDPEPVSPVFDMACAMASLTH